MNEASFWNWLEVSQLSRHCLCETTIYKWKLILNILSCPPYSAIRAVLVCRSLEFMTVRRSPKACSRDWKSPRESSEWDCSLHNLEMQIQQNVAKSRRVTRYYESQLERATSHGTLRLKWTRPRKSSWASSRRWRFVSSNDYGSLEFTQFWKYHRWLAHASGNGLTKTWRMSATAHHRT